VLQLKYNNEFLDLAPDENSEMEKNSPLFLGLDTLLAEYSTPIAIKYSDKNARLLGYLFFDLTVKTKSSFEVEIYSAGTFITRSTLIIESAGMNFRFAGKSSISGYLLTGISNFFTYIKDKKLTQLSLGGGRTYNYTTSDPTDGTTGYWQHFQGTWEFEDDYVILPMRNEAYTEDDILFTYSAGWMNKLDSSNNLVATQPVFPFPKLSYVLNQIFEEAGWHLDTTGLNDTEWMQLLMYSNYIVRTTYYTLSGETVTNSPYASVTVSLNNAMPQDITCSRFILEVCKRYLWFPITDTATHTVKLIALKEVGNRTRKDWTQYADAASTSDFAAPPRIFAFKNQFEGDDQYPSSFDTTGKEIVQASGFEDPPDVSAGGDLYDHFLFYVFRENKYYSAQYDGTTSFFEDEGDNIYDEEPENATDTYETAVTTMPLQKVQFDNGNYGNVPVVNQERGTKWGIRTMLYHGLAQQVDSSGDPVADNYYPYGSSINTPPSGTPQLIWSNVYIHTEYVTEEGVLTVHEFGIIEYWAKRWINMIASGEVIKRNFYLPLHEIVKFQWNDIILVHNIPHLIKSYVEPLNKQGFIQATLQRIILS
jgi:hypothetical protein